MNESPVALLAANEHRARAHDLLDRIDHLIGIAGCRLGRSPAATGQPVIDLAAQALVHDGSARCPGA